MGLTTEQVSLHQPSFILFLIFLHLFIFLNEQKLEEFIKYKILTGVEPLNPDFFLLWCKSAKTSVRGELRGEGEQPWVGGGGSGGLQ